MQILKTTVIRAFLALFLLPVAPLSAESSSALLVARYEMNPSPDKLNKLVDSGPFHYNGVLAKNVTYIPGPNGTGKALYFPGVGPSDAMIPSAPQINRALTGHFSVTAWVRPDKPSDDDNYYTAFVTTHIEGFHGISIVLGMSKQGKIKFECDDGYGASPSATVGQLKMNEWQHIAVTYDTGGDRVIYLNGIPVDTRHVGSPCNPNTGRPESGTIWFGRNLSSAYHGALGTISFYEGALTAGQIKADMDGTLPVTPVTPADIPPALHGVTFFLTRFDQPIGSRTDYAPTRKTIMRAPGPNAVDWPVITVDGTPVFTNVAKEGKQALNLPIHAGGALADKDGGKFNSILRVDGDMVVSPGNHWLRPLSWLWNRTVIYTVDPTARGSNDNTPPNYELFTFPVLIKGPSTGQIRSVILTSEGKTVYQRQETLDSLTLVLPAAKYELQVNGSAPQTFEAGLEPIMIGHPRDIMRNVNLAFSNGITASLSTSRDASSEQKSWDDDVALMAKGFQTTGSGLDMINRPAPAPFVDVPVSPIQTHGIAMSHGMSGGWFGGSAQGPAFSGDLKAFADHLADLGYDQVIEGIDPGRKPKQILSEEWLDALAERDIKGGVYAGTLADANLPLFFYGLADYHAPKIRDMQLAVQRFAPYPNFLGVYFGGDNGGYARYWDWSPPKTRWAEAYQALVSGTQSAPSGPQIQGGRKDTESHFLDYVAKFDQMWDAYGQLARAATDIFPKAVVTMGCFGSSPGGLGHGGWPIGTMPGKLIFDNVPVQMAYDWNEQNTSLPLHLVALLDRLKSDHPTTPTWAQVDDFRLFFGREARQRAYALALTRGLTSIGSNFLASGQAFAKEAWYPGFPASSASVDAYRDLFKWVHTYGGAYADTKPDAKIAILYVNAQAISRGVSDKNGSHEGKTTEALFLCHAAGWPAKIVTPEELKRGLDPGISALLLVGLNKIDNTWVWYQDLMDALNRFAARGGKILVDDESVSPLPAIRTRMKVSAYLNQTGCKAPKWASPSIQLFERNEENIGLLQKAMGNTPPPVAASNSATIWAVPHTTGDVKYVTVVNWGYTPGTNADQNVLAQTGTLTWHTDRPIYDVRAGRLVTGADAAHVNLTKDGFCLYALPPKPVEKPALALNGATATVDVGGTLGVPVRIDVHANNQTYTVFAASGTATKLPLQKEGQNQVQATELLSGQTSNSVDAKASIIPTVVDQTIDSSTRIAHFLSRKDIPVVVALTNAQAADAKMATLADHLVGFLKAHGRQGRVGRADPTDVVQSIQMAQSANQYPKWQTADVDLVLLGSATDNVLIFDQVRGCLLPTRPAKGHALLTFSPFVGGYEALNILGTDLKSLEASVEELSSIAPRLNASK